MNKATAYCKADFTSKGIRMCGQVSLNWDVQGVIRIFTVIASYTILVLQQAADVIKCLSNFHHNSRVVRKYWYKLNDGYRLQHNYSRQ